MAEGKSASLIPSDSEVNTKQAADMLNVSRPHIVKLLEEGKIPFRKVGSHRRVLLEDLMKYDAEMKGQRTKSLEFLAKQAQDLNLGYE
jgi:excisionase family DNA binding protein